MLRTFKISEARARLFDLVDQVTSAGESVVLIEHRDRAERAALVSEQHLRYLYATIEELRKRGIRPFRLAGSMKLLVSEDGLEAAIERTRREQTDLARSKFDDL
jgi:PHD/YefM family antitoxin component YafN of YafNO toxin-antitoxin module